MRGNNIRSIYSLGPGELFEGPVYFFVLWSRALDPGGKNIQTAYSIFSTDCKDL